MPDRLPGLTDYLGLASRAPLGLPVLASPWHYARPPHSYPAAERPSAADLQF
jgi:hypothetical protein